LERVSSDAGFPIETGAATSNFEAAAGGKLIPADRQRP
jgi:hypothetical protein